MVLAGYLLVYGFVRGIFSYLPLNWCDSSKLPLFSCAIFVMPSDLRILSCIPLWTLLPVPFFFLHLLPMLLPLLSELRSLASRRGHHRCVTAMDSPLRPLSPSAVMQLSPWRSWTLSPAVAMELGLAAASQGRGPRWWRGGRGSPLVQGRF